ncbi:MAG: radical SAM protein [Myxococcales bacterium]|nr:radical SAM protein [Myxococcales bacterium]
MTRGAAHILLSRACVNDCVFCTAVDHRLNRDFARREDVLAYLRRVVDEGVPHLVLSGIGEPTLDPNFEEYLEVAHGLGFRHIQLFTNGYRCTRDRVQRWRSRGLTSVLISMHGIEEDHDAVVQRSGSFAEAVEATRLYAEARIHVSVNTCITRSNLDRLPELRALIRELPVSRHAFSFLEWSGGVLHHPEIAPDYQAVGAAASRLVSENDQVAYFDNIPYCIVNRPIREVADQHEVRLLQGAEDLQIDSTIRKEWPSACRERSCPRRPTCPGFERRYIECRGWQQIPELVTRFLDDLESRPTAMANQPRRLLVQVPTTIPYSTHSPLGMEPREDSGESLDGDAVTQMYEAVRDHCRRESAEVVTIEWMGGDSLRLGPAFFRAAFSRTQPWRTPTVSHVVRSNLLLFDETWGELLQEFGCGLRTTTDPLFDDARTVSGQASHAQWWDNVVLAYELGLDLEVALSLGKAHVGRAEQIYAFARNLQLLGSRPIATTLTPDCWVNEAASPGGEEQGIDAAEFGSLVAQLGTLWVEDGRLFPLYPLSEWLVAPPSDALGSVLQWDPAAKSQASDRCQRTGRLVDLTDGNQSQYQAFVGARAQMGVS